MSWLNRSRATCGGDVAGNGRHLRLFSAVTCLLLCSLVAAEEGTGEVVSAEKVTAITAADVDLWVRNLDSDHYADRQAAMKNLRRSGTAGIPALAAAARSSNLESTARSIELLTQMYESADAEVALAADEALESLGERGPAVAVVRSQQALSTTLALDRRRHAIAAVKRMGGNIIPFTKLDDEGEKEIEADLNDEGTISNVILGRRWTGGLNGVKYLQRLPELRNIIMTKDIPLTLDEQDQLRAKLAGVRIELRGSAYLGIRSQQAPNQEPCIVDHVVPKSPADLGGLQARDEITHLDGVRVNNFPTLTELLSTKHGGEVVYLEICRGDEFLELEVTLREW
ncbi:MAG: PDZ domain-containing protein [Planctomycetota bacterium]